MSFFLSCVEKWASKLMVWSLCLDCLTARTLKSQVIFTLRLKLKGGWKSEEVMGRLWVRKSKADFLWAPAKIAVLAVEASQFFPNLPNGSKCAFVQWKHWFFFPGIVFMLLSFSPCIIFITHVNIMYVRRFPADGTWGPLMWGVCFAASLLSLFSSTSTHFNVLVLTDSNHLIDSYFDYQLAYFKYN